MVLCKNIDNCDCISGTLEVSIMVEVPVVVALIIELGAITIARMAIAVAVVGAVIMEK